MDKVIEVKNFSGSQAIHDMFPQIPDPTEAQAPAQTVSQVLGLAQTQKPIQSVTQTQAQARSQAVPQSLGLAQTQTLTRSVTQSQGLTQAQAPAQVAQKFLAGISKNIPTGSQPTAFV